MKTAVIIGGNQSGLNMARCLADVGFKVTLFEKKAQNEVAFDWTDDVDPTIFSTVGIPLPPEGTYFKKKDWTFVNPSETVKITVHGGAQSEDISVYRRPLNDYLYGLACDKATIKYGTEVNSLIVEGKKVVGVTVGEEKIFCDLVVDCSGALSTFRASLPEETMIQCMPDKNELFYAYRGFFKAKDGVKAPEMTNKAYLRHGKKEGISWCIYHEGTADVLIGRIGGITEEEINDALNELKKDNPIIGEELVKAGFVSIIPVRYPISRMVADGYVLCGDSAFMTIPMMGSGIACSLDCGKMLADVLKRSDDCGVKNLWYYQVAFFKKYAAFLGVDLLKRWLLSTAAENVDFLFESGVIDEEMLANGVGGEGVKMPFGVMMKKGWLGRKRLGVLLQVAGIMSKSDKANALARNIPEEFDEEEAVKWQNRIDGLFNR